MKLFFKKQDIVSELMEKCAQQYHIIDLTKIELEALDEISDDDLMKEIRIRKIVLQDILTMAQQHLEQAQEEITVEEALSAHIKNSIKTKRYQQLNELDIDGFYFDGEC